MKRALLLMALLAGLCAGLQAQTYTSITGSNLTDLNGNKLAQGTICFLGTDQADQPVSFGLSGGGQVLRRPSCFTVTNGAIQGGAQIPNPATTSPSGILYRITVTDTQTKQVVLVYNRVSLQGTSWDFDSYQPLGIPVPPPPNPANVTGPLNVSGDMSVTGTTSLGTINATTTTAKSIGQVRYADQFPGADIGAQINAAIANLGTAGGTVIVPRGSYTLSTSVPITQPNVCIKGQDSQATSIALAPTFNSDAFKWDIGAVDSSTPLQNGCLEGLTIYGNAQANAVGVHIEDTTGLVLRDVAVMNFTGTSGKGIYLDNETAWTERTVFDHVTAQNNTASYYFYKGASTSSSFGYTSWLASHITANNGQVGIYIANGADLYHSTLDFKANLQPFTNTASSVLIEVAGSMVQDYCEVTGEFTGSSSGSGGTNYGIRNDTTAAVECAGVFDVAQSVNTGPVYVGDTTSDGANSTILGSMPDGSPTFTIATDRLDTSLGNTHPFFGVYNNNGTSRDGFVFDFHNCITADGRCGIQLFDSSGSTAGWLSGLTPFGTWTADGKLTTNNIIASVTPGTISAGLRVTNGTGNFQMTSGCSAANAGDACLYDVTTGHFPWSVAANTDAISFYGPATGPLGNFTTLQQGGVQVAITGVDINTTNQVTATHLATPLPTAQGGTGVNSAATFPGSGTVAVTSQLPLSATLSTWSPGAISAGACATTTQSVANATASMEVAVSPAADPGAGLTWSGWVSAAGTVSVRLCNTTAASITPNAESYNVRVIQ